MRQMLQWVLMAAVCTVLAAGTDPGLVEAQSSFDEAMKLRSAGKYADAIQKAERALSLWEAALGLDPVWWTPFEAS